MNKIFNACLAFLLIYGCTNQVQPEQTTSVKEKVEKAVPKKSIAPALLQYQDTNTWEVYNRKMTLGEEVHLHAGPNDGLLWNKKEVFGNGTIEFDMKGRDTRGTSFVGLAFHIQDNERFDAIYFRPFNFKSAEKSGNSLQYVSLPDFDWRKLRTEHPGVYENAVSPVPEPEEWVHVKVEVEHPTVKVYVNNSHKPSLTVDQLTTWKKGGYGFWVGHNSLGDFKNLKVIPND